jgi:hypothetical protein
LRQFSTTNLEAEAGVPQQAYSISPGSGQLFEILLDRFEIVYENTKFFENRLRVRKVNRTRSVYGYVDIKVPMGNDFKASGVLLKKQGGEYRYMPYKLPPQPFCDSMSKDTYVYPDIAANSDFPEDLSANCPLAPVRRAVGRVRFHFRATFCALSGELHGQRHRVHHGQHAQGHPAFR